MTQIGRSRLILMPIGPDMMKAYAGGWMPRTNGKAPKKRKAKKKPAPNVVTLPSRINRMNPSGMVIPQVMHNPYEAAIELICHRLAQRALA